MDIRDMTVGDFAKMIVKDIRKDREIDDKIKEKREEVERLNKEISDMESSFSRYMQPEPYNLLHDLVEKELSRT